jgi:regulator of protease activity HflC (stomatin/prohibitin superfamily)
MSKYSIENLLNYNVFKNHYFKIILGFSLLFAFSFFIGNNNDQSWLILQYPWGNVRVIDSAGWYLKGGGNHWNYPRNWQVEYDSEHTFKVVFNDGGGAMMNAMVRFSSPITIDGKRKFHQLFAGNEEAVEAAVWAHISDAMKSSGPVMSASEHQSARRGEFTSLVQDQLQKGLFEMKRVSKTLQDQYDDKGKPITVYATEVVFDSQGHEKIARPSPLTDFGLVITQFSITDVTYDDQTQRQFAQKKEAFLSAEGSNAQREKEVQERLMVEERGRREKAESESIALRRKAEEVINGQREKEVAELKAQKDKVVAELQAAQELAVAKLNKEQAETRANQELEVAKLDRMRAEEEAQAQIILANAREQSLKLAGAISERDRVLAQIEADRQVGVARELAKINVPQFVINGGSNNETTSSNMNDSLMNVLLLKQMGVLPELGVKK